MATFRVGQRVRVVGLPKRTRFDLDWIIGHEATIEESHFSFEWLVRVDGLGPVLDASGLPHTIGARGLVPLNSEHLAPLTNPGDEAWAADQVKKWTKPEPVVPVPQQEKERT